MIDPDTVILITLCLIILLLLHLLSKKNVRRNPNPLKENFEIVNDVPEEDLVELNYVKKMIPDFSEKQAKCSDDGNTKCSSNAHEKWCM